MATFLLFWRGMASLQTLSTLAVAASLLSVACSDDDRPTDRVLAKTTQLVQYQTCSALESDLEAMLIREVSASIDRYGDNGFGFDDSAPTAGESDDSGGRQEGVDFSGTNNQESGVDEADFVKTDGFHVYALNGNELHIFGVPTFGMLVPTSATPVEGHARQLLIHKDANRAVVFSSIDVTQLPEGHPLREAVGYQQGDGHDAWYWRSRSVSKITVFDMTDRANLALLREVYFEGAYQTARKVDTSIRLASYAAIDRPELWSWYRLVEQHGKAQTKAIITAQIRALSLADLIPQLYVRNPDGSFRSDSLSTSACRSFYRPTDSHARGISSIISFDLLGNSLAWDADHVVSNPAVFYASTDRIVLAESAHSWWWYSWFPQDPDQLNVHAFDISRPGKSQYVGSGRVEGMLSDQFAIDEEDGAFRLATTTNAFRRWWSDDADEAPLSENHVWVLEQSGSSLATVGHIGGIAKGERIMSARFIGGRGYLVTFRNIDPLFTIDLTDNANPTLVGELKIPGFSTYIHPLGDDNLLTIGVGGDDNGANWRTTISLFDVADFAHPALDVSLPIDGEAGWGWSEALWEHKAFQYWAPKKLLAVPQATYAYATSGGTGATYRYISKLELIEVDPSLGAGGLRRYGAIDHSSYYQAAADQYWQYVDIRRSIFMGEYIYAISDKAISVHRTSDLVKVTDALLPGYQPNDYYWWW